MPQQTSKIQPAQPKNDNYEQSESGIWIPKLFPKQIDVFNSRAKALLVCGPRFSGKTWAVLHRVVRHLWETPGARVALFSKTIKTAKDGGIWEDLTCYTLPEWFAANLTGMNDDIVFQYTVEPKIDGQTRTLYFRVRNYWGGESELKLFSLDYDADVEAKVKGTRFSMMWFSELSNFQDRKVFTTTKQQLRMPHLRDDQHQWIADTNPADEGEESWIYQVWYKERMLDEAPAQFKSDAEKAGFKTFQKQLGLIEIMLTDNPYLTEEKKTEIRNDYHYDPDLYARYVEGKWTGISGKKRVFRDIFNTLHIAGDAESNNEDDWEIITPSENCVELICGWDLGDVNHSAHILEKIVHGNDVHWRVLDELVVIKREVTIEDFTIAFLEKMEFYNRVASKPIRWTHWSDDSALTRFRSTVGEMDANIVKRASNGKITLQGVDKPADSVMKRVALLRRLLLGDRVKVSANCKSTIEMLKKLAYGPTKAEPVEGDRHKHPFDSLSYAILMESAWDEFGHAMKTAKRNTATSIRSIPL